jgi:transposase-like protein
MATRNTYTDYDRERAIAAYVDQGTYAGASKITGIPESTIRLWHDQRPTWWHQVEEQQRELFEEQQLAVLAEIRSRSARETLDRLENGDERIVQGQKMRVKVSAKDSATIYGIATDKARILRGQPTSISAKQTAEDKLKELRQAARAEAVKEGKASGKVAELKASIDDDTDPPEIEEIRRIRD